MTSALGLITGQFEYGGIELLGLRDVREVFELYSRRIKKMKNKLFLCTAAMRVVFVDELLTCRGSQGSGGRV